MRPGSSLTYGLPVIRGTHSELKRHNRRSVLAAMYRLQLSSRVALAAETGLTKPTISSIVSELLEEGLVSEDGRGRSTGQGGKRPTLLRFQPASRQVIGIALEPGRALGLLADMSGDVTAQHVIDRETLPLDEALALVAAGLIPQLDAPLLGIGLALPGKMDTETGTVLHSAALGLQQVQLTGRLEEEFRTPVWLANYAELSALGKLAFGAAAEARPRTLVTISLDGQVELGVSQQHGAEHYGSELAAPVLRDLGLDQASLASLLPRDSSESWLALRYLNLTGDKAALARTSELAERLGRLIAWTVLMLGPDLISLSGGVTDLGEEFLRQLRDSTDRQLGPGVAPTLELARSLQLGPLGAVALVLQQELELLR